MLSLNILALAAVETLKISVPTIADAVVHRTNYRRCDVRLDAWSRRLLEQAELGLRVQGREHIQPGQSYVVMSNHQSLYDIPVVFQALGVPVRMIAKTELFRIPVMGRAMLDSGFVELDRSNRRRALHSLKVAKQRILEDGLSIWIAPEGTRSKDGQLGQFKSGGFHLALEAGVPILPVTIDGSYLAHRSGAWQVQRGVTVGVEVHPPVLAAQFGRARINELMNRVRASISAGLPGAPVVLPNQQPLAS